MTNHRRCCCDPCNFCQTGTSAEEIEVTIPEPVQGPDDLPCDDCENMAGTYVLTRTLTNDCIWEYTVCPPIACVTDDDYCTTIAVQITDSYIYVYIYTWTYDSTGRVCTGSEFDCGGLGGCKIISGFNGLCPAAATYTFRIAISGKEDCAWSAKEVPFLSASEPGSWPDTVCDFTGLSATITAL